MYYLQNCKVNMSTVFHSTATSSLSEMTLLSRPREKAVLLAHPKYFDVKYVINPHMQNNIGCVDTTKAHAQWERLKSCYERLNFEVHVIPPVEDLPDLVFAANQSLPYQTIDGEKVAIISKMHSPYRQPEVEHFADWYEKNGFRVIRQNDPPVDFEGNGDVIWHPGKQLLYIGFGYRTDKTALKRAAKLINAPVIGLELVDPRFYHLDTALCPLDSRTAIYVPAAFSAEGKKLIKQSFPRLIEAPIDEALNFVANGHCPDANHFIVQEGSPVVTQSVKELGFKVMEIDTSEFMKSGGSVYCMKMMLP
jgi:N-dimethylarginine dimethylaminohydrolase